MMDLEQRSGSRRALIGAALAFASAAAFTLGALDEAYAQAGAYPAGPLRMGAGDVGILNFALALEDLEAAFYTQVLRTPFVGMARHERRVLQDVREHEVAHARFLRKTLGRDALGQIPVNFGRVNFADRASVLMTAITFEDTGVSAYNGAGQYLSNPSYLLAAGQIVSVEARHAAALRDLANPFTASFAGDDVVNILGLDVSRSPGEVAPLVQPYIATPFTA